MQTKFLFTVLCFFASTLASKADVSLHPLFGDHMVLQRERPLPVWGKADAGEAVSVTFAGTTQNATAGADGKWMVFFPPQTVSKTPQNLTVKGKNEIIVRDVLVGDVWLGTGQSNMDFSVSGTDRKEEVKAMPAGSYDGIRMFKVEQVESDTPLADLKGQWKEPTPDNIMGFSATLFYFAEELHKKMPDVPLGLVRSSVGATNLYCWIPNEVRDKDPSAEALRTWWDNATKTWSPERQAQRDQEQKDYQAEVDAYKARNEKLPDAVKKPGELMGSKWSRRPSALYNGMIAPLQPLCIRGMIWYQGEWDAKKDWVKTYHDLFVAFAKSWREHWVAAAGGQASAGDFPIYIVQLPAREAGDGDYWPYMREVEERLATSVPKSGFVVTYDTNDPHNLHPKEKTPVGQRLAWLALAKEYGQNVPWHGPTFKSVSPQGEGLLLTFDVGADALKSSDGQALRYFEIAGKDGIYFPAAAEIRGGTVYVYSKEVRNPETVRYAFVPAPEKPNFYNSEGLPAAPFRTDKQPVPDQIAAPAGTEKTSK